MMKQGKEGACDWVCLNCTNLNYSFRKVCNRCRTVTRQQNQQNYLHMHYLHIYYQTPYLNAQDAPATAHNAHPHTHTAEQQTHTAEQHKLEELNTISRKQSESSERSDLTDLGSVDWGSSESESKFLFLLENAWEGLYCKPDVSEFKTCEEIEHTREDDSLEDHEDVLTGFDFTFI